VRPISRRTVLRGAGAAGTVAIGLPLLEAMMPRAVGGKSAFAQSSLVPKRLVVVFTANGTVQSLWAPSSGGSALDLAGHPIHAPLEPFQNKLLMVHGVDQEMAYNSIGDGHQTGMACLLTNEAILPGNLFCEGGCEPGSEKYVGWGGGISVDQYVANEIEKDVVTKFRSLELGVQTGNGSVWSRMSYANADEPLPHRNDPNQNFVDIFGDLVEDPFKLELIRKKRHSVLDVVIPQYEAFNKTLGKADRVRLDQHLESIRAVEKRIDSVGGVGEHCEQPTIEDPGDVNQNDNFPAVGRAQMDLLVMSLACDLTRVASLQWSGAVSNKRFSWLPEPISEGHHDLSHYEDGDAYAQDALTRINHWYTEQFAYLIGAMDAIDEGDGTMLDNSVVLWVNELGQGNSHTRRDIPFIIAGGGQGFFQTGRYLDLGGAYHGRLLVSICNAMDKPVDTFGRAEYSQGPLVELQG
jgi:hypothetical protein